jgi:hypothetical protein
MPKRFKVAVQVVRAYYVEHLVSTQFTEPLWNRQERFEKEAGLRLDYRTFPRIQV